MSSSAGGSICPECDLRGGGGFGSVAFGDSGGGGGEGLGICHPFNSVSVEQLEATVPAAELERERTLEELAEWKIFSIQLANSASFSKDISFLAVSLSFQESMRKSSRCS